MPRMKEQKHDRSDAQIKAAQHNWTKFQLKGMREQLKNECMQNTLSGACLQALNVAIEQALNEVK